MIEETVLQSEQQMSPPSYMDQKQTIQPLLTQPLTREIVGKMYLKSIIVLYLYVNRYLVDQKWFKQWKKYVGFDSMDQYSAGNEAANPGSIDNGNLFKGNKLIT